MSQREDLKLLEQIETLYKDNARIIEGIRNKKGIIRYCYDLSQDPNTKCYTVSEEKCEKDGAEVLEGWQISLNLVPVEDFFNDELNFKVKNFEELTSLNDSMLKIARKFKLFGGSKEATEEMKKYKANFESIKIALGGLEDGTIDSSGALHIIEQKVAKVNESMKELTTTINQYGFESLNRWSIPCTSHTISNDRKTATLISGQYGGLLSKNGYSSGVHTWKLKIIERTSTCMIGVAPETVSKQSGVNNYNTNGFYVDLNTGTKYSGPPFSYSNTAYASAIKTGDILKIKLDCEEHTLTYIVNDKDLGVAYTGLPKIKFFLCWDNNTTAGSKIELI